MSPAETTASASITASQARVRPGFGVEAATTRGTVLVSLPDVGFHFPTATVGYAVGEERVTVKTEDGGHTWKVLVGPEEAGDQRVWNLFFLDANRLSRRSNSGTK